MCAYVLGKNSCLQTIVGILVSEGFDEVHYHLNSISALKRCAPDLLILSKEKLKELTGPEKTHIFKEATSLMIPVIIW